MNDDACLTESPRLREAGREVLSLALIDARNHTLRLFAVIEAALGESGLAVQQTGELDPPLWLLGHIGWFQEAWIARNMQRQRGERCDATAPRLASIEPNADGWWDAAHLPQAQRWQLELPALERTRHYLLETLDITLDLLAGAPDDDAALYFYRLALFHEDMQGEAFARMAQTLDIGARPLAQLLPQPAPRAPRDALLFPATQWLLGMPRAQPGFVFDNEQWAHEVPVPAFEIDAQPVSWAQYAEFVEDGGYDEARWWLPAGWSWLQHGSRRTPRHVEQLRHGVLARRFGQLVRVPMQLPAVHLSWYEADAWCRWAGRRLPAEVEWEAAACSGASRGFTWGEVWEWTASTFRPYPGFAPGPDRGYSAPCFGSHKALRGASFATRARLKHPKLRNFQWPERDDGFVGFRSCAL